MRDFAGIVTFLALIYMGAIVLQRLIDPWPQWTLIVALPGWAVIVGLIGGLVGVVFG